MLRIEPRCIDFELQFVFWLVAMNIHSMKLSHCNTYARRRDILHHVPPGASRTVDPHDIDCHTGVATAAAWCI